MVTRGRETIQKRGVRKLAGAGAALAAALLAVSGLADTFPYETQLADNVNMRRNASSASIVLERLEKGDTVTVLGEAGAYYKISYDGRTGYAMKEFVTGNTAAVTHAPSAEKAETVSGYPYETTTSAKVNFRKRANTSSDLIDRIPQGADIIVNGVSGSFLAITYQGREGYVMAEFVNVKEIASSDGSGAIPGSETYISLQSGATGAEVRALQQALAELGYLGGSVDGVFGASTESALRAFQGKNAYPVNGIADVNLQALIYEGKPLNSRGVKTTVKTLAPIAGTTMRLNDTGDAVTVLQERLKALKYYDGEASGVYTQETVKAVKAFQRKHSLTADGKAGKATQAVLFSGDALSSDSDATLPPVTPTPKPTPRVTPSAMVKAGAKGEDARLVQQRLKELGYLTGEADGIYGTASVRAMKEFQAQNGLNADGICGTATRKLLFSDSAKVMTTPTPRPTLAPEATMPPVTKDNVVVLRLGASGDAVLYLQKRLTELGYYTARMDGNYLSDDMAAVQTFQELNRLDADGIAGYETQVKLYSNSAVGPDGINTTLATLRRGDSGTAVKEMQQRLIELGYLTSSADGRYGTQTAEAVVSFQKANDLARDGVAGKATLTKLYSGSAIAASKVTATPMPEVVAGTTVRKGDINDAVKELQRKLISLGFLSGKADGNFGVRTYAALLDFQTQNGLAADGIAGKNTWDKLLNGNAVGPNKGNESNSSGSSIPKASSVIYANWYSTIRAKARQYPYATVYDFATGISWQVHMFSLGAHADSEPLTAADTANLLKAFGGKNTWNPRAVWVVFGDGSVYLASTHSMPHEVQHRTNNNFDGHLCIHFPRTAAQVAAIGPYATSHQSCIDKAWITTQNMAK